ncbi:hypothetical protein K440DRAFT_575873 [Wilcoxina mikolae CBS 423.85]|nr:hypothetical protein K440DRAFT_575873 [Wilcoxina mikolae CBS 423.85]
MSTKDYFLASARLSSFRSQRRSSVAGSAKATKWPHRNMPPKRFAEAGFYFDPSPDHDDNVTCYLCLKSLDGWESGDDPVAEHLRHSDDCGWAVTAANQVIEDGQYTSDPHSEQFHRARLMTFGQGRWPHEDSDNLNVANMASAGFHYAPTKNESDYCLCPFCGVSLANFEPEDNPRDEHQRRAPTCYFFTTEAAKKSSKRAPRTSTVPKKQTRRASRALTVPESPAEQIVDTTEDDEPAPKKTRGKRSSSVKPKATTTKKGGRKKAAAPEYPASTHSLSDTDDILRRGRKRSSSAISKEPVILFDGRADTDEEDEIVVQPKKRATRASMARQQPSVDQTAEPPKRQRATRASIARTTKQEDEMTLTDVEDSIVVKPKKARRTVSKSKTAIKTPSIHRAYMPTDKDFDHALGLDLEQPLTDEDESAIHQKPFIRSTKRLTRSRTSIAVEQQMRDAPSDVLIPAARKIKPSAGESAGTPRGKTPLKQFFRDGSQDFSMPIKVPKHLNQDIEILDQHSDAPSEVEEEPAPQPPPKKARGRQRKMSVDQPKVEDPKPKRTKVAKKVWPTRSRSNTVEAENLDSILSKTFGAAPEEPAESTQSRQPEQPEPIGRPKRGRQKKLRQSVASLASTIPDHLSYQPEVQEEVDALNDQIEPQATDILADDDPSDSGSVIHHQIEVRDSFHIHDSTISSDAPVEEVGSAIKSTGKSSPSKSRLKGKSLCEVEDDASEAPGNDRARSSIPSSPFQEHTSPLPEPAEMEMEVDGRSDEPETFLPDDINGGEKSCVSVRSHAPPPPPQSPDPVDGPSLDNPRSPLSPIRRQLRVPLQSTPKKKPARTFQTSQPWTPIDLDIVFATQDGAEEDAEVGLTAAEREMTVEEWVKWKATNGQRRLNEAAERMISILELKGREARKAIEGIATS